ncbi:MAG: methionyl-tRNA formyltransferase, partial [Microcystaceae cyanobacterium]
FQGQILKVFKTVPRDFDSQQLFPDSLQPLIPLCSSLSTPQGEPGEIVALWKNWGPVIQTGEGFLLLHQVQPPGKRPQSGWDWVNGSRLSLGMKLTTLPVE